MTPTRLVSVAHGTRTPAGNEVAVALTRAAGELLGLPATTAYVELAEPLLTDVVADLDEPAVVVPQLLSTGFHIRTDLPSMVAGAPVAVRLGRSLGPHALLARALVERLREAGVAPGHPVVLAAAGSTDPLALRDLRRAAELLAQAWGGRVRSAVLGGPGPALEDVVEPGDALSPYLLAEGYFARSLRERAPEGSVVADVVGPHPAVAELVARRARALLSARRWR